MTEREANRRALYMGRALIRYDEEDWGDKDYSPCAALNIPSDSALDEHFGADFDGTFLDLACVMYAQDVAEGRHR